MRPFARPAVYLVIATWAAALAGDGRNIQGASPESTTKVPTIIVKSVKPKETSPTAAAAYGLTRNDYDRIVQTLPSLRRAIPIRETVRRAQVRDRSVDVQVIGTTEQFAEAHPLKVINGRFFAEKDLKTLANVAVIDRDTARQLFIHGAPIGESIRIDGTHFLVVGVIADGSAPPIADDSGRRGGTAREVFIPLSTMRSRLGDSQMIGTEGTLQRETLELSRIEITVDEPANLDRTAELIRRLLKRFHEKPDYAVEIVR